MGTNKSGMNNPASNEMIPWGKPCLGEKERDYLLRAIDSTWISGGEFVDKFEHDFSRLIGAKYAITTSNGTAALHLALTAIGVRPGDEVIVPDFTFVAPGNMALLAGAKLVYAEIDQKTWCIDVQDIERKITRRTRAIVAVHIYGNVCDMEALVRIAKEANVYLIEDAAEAVLSKYQGRYAGSFGDLGCFSFQATKTITMGEGGAVATNSAKLAQQIRVLRSHGMREDKRYWHDVVGFNYRLTNLQASLGCAQLENRDFIIKEKKRIYDRYRANLSGVKGIELQHFSSGVEPVVWAVALRIRRPYFTGTRDFLIAELLRRNIETRPGFYPFSAMPLYRAKSLPATEAIARDVISLPSYISLPDETIDYICDQFKSLMKKR